MLDSWGKCWTPLASVRQMLDSQFRQADGPCSVSDSAHGQTAQITTSIRIVAHVSKKILSLSREGQMAIGMKTNRSHVITVAYLKWLMLLLQMEAERRIVFVTLVYVQGERICAVPQKPFYGWSNIFARFGWLWLLFDFTHFLIARSQFWWEK